ncbi:MAG: translocation/assembly module TamB [Flavobacteriaceae bacterium]|nr:translocation/assembly module TamB [Flavobacteriaceae bacterium]
MSDLFFKNSEFNFDLDDLGLRYNDLILDDLNGKVFKLDSIIKLQDYVLKFGKSVINGNLEIDYSKIKSSYISSKDFLDQIKVNLSIDNSKLSSIDIGSFFPFFKTKYSEEWNLNLSLNGYTNNLKVDTLNISNSNNIIELNSTIKDLFSQDYSLKFNILNFNVDSKEIDKAMPNFFGTILPSSMKTFGRFNIDGVMAINSSEVESKFKFFTNDGLIISDLKIYDFKNIDNASYEGEISGFDINISNFLNNENLKNSNFNFKIVGKGFTREYLNSTLKGRIESLELFSYNLKNIDLEGNVKDQVFDGDLVVSDSGVSLFFNGLIDFSEEDLVDFDFDLDLANADLKIFNPNSKAKLSGKANVKLRGSKFENLIGDLTLNDIKYVNNQELVSFEDLKAQLRYNDDLRFVNITSNDIVSGIIIGEYNFFDLKNIFLNTIGSQYSNFNKDSNLNFNTISFNINLKPKFLNLLDNNLDIDENTFVSGNFKSNGEFNFNLKSKYLNYNQIKSEDIDLKFSNTVGSIDIGKLNSKFIEGTNLKVNTIFSNDTLYVSSNYKADKNSLNKLNFLHTINNKNNSVLTFTEVDLIINQRNWSLENNTKPNLILNNKFSFITANNISLVNDEQKIKLDLINNQNNYLFKISLNDVNIGSFINKNSSVVFDGLANGDLSISKNYNKYSGKSTLKLDNITVNNINIGKAVIELDTSNDSKEIELDLSLIKKSEKKLGLKGSFSIEDEFYPLNLNLSTYNFDISPFSAIGKNVINDFQGYFNSNIDIMGNSSSPIFSGIINTQDVSFKIPYLNVVYNIENNSSFILDDQSFFIDDFKIFNKKTKTDGVLSGKISHNLFKNWFLELDINSENLLILDTKLSNNELYFGKGMFNGNTIVYGPGDNLLIKLSGSTNEGTSLVIPLNDSKNIGDLKFINFIDPNSNKDTTFINNKSLFVDLDINFNPNAKLEVIFDSDSESKITGYGNGNLNFKINTSGNFNLFGDFELVEGSYFYRSLGFVSREFKLNKGSKIIWSGDPYLGKININANYEIPGGANPAILIRNTNFNRKIPTTVNINLEGNFNEMKTPLFKINFPNTSGPIKSELDYYLVDQEKRQKQALSLLYQATFIDEVSLTSISSQAITNNLFQSASGLIDNIFTNSDDKMNIGINYLKGDKNAASSLLNRDRLGLTLKSEISDKILINGKIGVPVGGVEENVIIGNVQIEFLLNEEGNLKARFFNKENEYQYFGDDIGYTQGMGISYEIDFNDFKSLFKKSVEKKTKE